MRRRLLQFLATFTFRRAVWIFPLIVILTWLAIRQGLQLHYDTSLGSFLPPASAEARLMRELLGDYRKLEPVLVVLRSREAGREVDLIMLARELARWLDDQIYFNPPQYKSQDTAQFQNLTLLHLAQLLPPEDWDGLDKRLEVLLKENQTKFAEKSAATTISQVLNQDLVTSSLLQALDERMAITRGPVRMLSREGHFFSQDGRALFMLLYPALSPEDGADALNTLRFAKRCRRFLFERHPDMRDKISVDFQGSIVSTGQGIEKLARELALILWFSISLALLLYLLVFRKFESLFFIALPPAIGFVWTLALARMTFGEVSGVALMFLLIIAAIGLEYTIHLYHRFTLELYRTHHYYRALARSFVETGRGILSSALLMTLLFMILFLLSLSQVGAGQSWIAAFTRASGFARLGLVCGMGIVCNLLACLLALPLMASIKHLLAHGRIKPVPLYRFRLERLYTPAIIRPRATLVVILLVGAVLAVSARRLEFSPDFAAISPFFYRPSSGSASPPKTMQAGNPDSELPRPGRPLVAVVSGRTLEEALEQNDRLESNLRNAMPAFGIFSYDSLRWILPSLSTQKASLERLKAIPLDKMRARMLRIAKELKLNPALINPLFNTLRTAQQSAQRPQFIVFGRESSEEFILNVQRHVTHQNDRHYVATVIYSGPDGFDQRLIPALQNRLGEGLTSLSLVGDPIIERHLALLLKINLAILILASSFSVVIALVLHFRFMRRSIIALLPILFVLIGLCGTMALGGIQLHFFTLLVLPLILCLAMDHSIQFTQYFYDRQPCSVRLVMQTLGRVLILSCGTIGLFLGTMTLTSNPGLRDFGSALLSGLLILIITISLLLPSLLQLFGKNQPAWQTLLPEPEG